MLDSSDADFYSAIELTTSPVRPIKTRLRAMTKRKANKQPPLNPIVVVDLLDSDYDSDFSVQVLDSDPVVIIPNHEAGGRERKNSQRDVQISKKGEDESDFESEILGGGFSLEKLKSTEETITKLKSIQQEEEANLEAQSINVESSVLVAVHTTENAPNTEPLVSGNDTLDSKRLNFPLKTLELSITITSNKKEVVKQEITDQEPKKPESVVNNDETVHLEEGKRSVSKSKSASPVKAKKKRSSAIEDDFFALAPKKRKTKRKLELMDSQTVSQPQHSFTSPVHSQSPKSSVTTELENVTGERKEILLYSEQILLETEFPGDKERQGVQGPLISKLAVEKAMDELNEREVSGGKTDDDVTDINNDNNDDNDNKGDEDDEFTLVTTKYDPKVLETDDSGYSFNAKNESTRVYQLLIKPLLNAAENMVNEFTVETNGNTKFSEIFQTKLLPQLEKTIRRTTTTQDVALVWVEGKTEIKYFFRPSTLRIEPTKSNSGSLYSFDEDGAKEVEKTLMTILIIPQTNVKCFAEKYPEYFRDGKSDAFDYLIQEASKEEEKYPNASDLDISDDEGESSTKLTAADSQPLGRRIGSEDKPLIEKIGGDGSSDSYFVIALKGRDNKRLEVKVCPRTSMNELLDYFLNKKNISKSIDMTKVKLVFDDEVIELDEVVANTELEEDFEIQVVL